MLLSLFPGVLSSQCDHAPGETSQVAHFVVQDAAPPFGNVGQSSSGLFDQMLFYRLKG